MKLITFEKDGRTGAGILRGNRVIPLGMSMTELIRSGAELPLILKSQEEDPAVNTLVYETGVPVCELDPLTSGPDDPPLDYYETVMLQNMNTLIEALSD